MTQPLDPATLVPSPTDHNRLGRQLQGGHLTATVTSPSGKHLTISIRGRKRRPAGAVGPRWQRANWDEAALLFVEETHSRRAIARLVPTEGNPHRTIQPSASAEESPLLWAAKAILWAAHGEPRPGLEFASADRCGICNRALTDPESIERGIGPDCFGKSTASKYATQGVAA